MRASGLIALLGFSLLASAPPAAVGKVTVSATVAQVAGGGRLAVSIRSTTGFTARTRPRSVTAKLATKRYKLHHLAGTAAAKPAVSGWQSDPAAALSAAAGKRLVVRVVTRRATRSYSTKITQEGGTTTGGGGNTTTPGGNTTTPGGNTTTPGGGTTTQQDPRTRFLAMFNNSGWDRPWTADTPQHEPMEDLYNFCASNTYHERFTNGMTGNDTFYQGSWQLTGDPQTGNVGGYDVVEGVVQTVDQNGQESTLYVDLSEQLPNVAYINRSEYTRVAAQAC